MDRTSVFHGLLSEPVVLCPLVGLLLGDPMLGLKVGAVLQLFFLGSSSVGGSSPPDAAMASIAVTVAASLASDLTGVPVRVSFPAAVLAAMAPASLAGSFADGWIKENNVKLLHETEEAVELVGAEAIEKAVKKSLATSFLFFALIGTIVAALATVVTGAVLYFLPHEWWKVVEMAGNMILPASVAVALASLRERRALWVYAGASVCILIAITGWEWLF